MGKKINRNALVTLDRIATVWYNDIRHRKEHNEQLDRDRKRRMETKCHCFRDIDETS